MKRKPRYSLWEKVVSYLYNVFILLILPLLPFVFLFHFWKMWTVLFPRLGINYPPPLPTKKSKRIWFHCVSVGESNAAKPVMKLIKSRHPDWEIIGTTTTIHGYDLLRKDANVNYLFFFPLDYPYTIKKFLSAMQPDLIGIFETEFWPNLSYYAYKRGIPLLLLNGRISTRTHGEPEIVKHLHSFCFKHYTAFLVQTETDKSRLKRFTDEENKILVVGNTKCDFPLPSADAVERLKKELHVNDSDTLIVAGSTHKGEERLMLEAFMQWHSKHPKARLIIAPRHIERSKEILKELTYWSTFPIYLRTEKFPPNWKILILDTIGELVSTYALSTWAFVGGSYTPIGGHNPLEVAVWGKPVVMGKSYDNFYHLVEGLKEAGGLVVVKNKKEFFKIGDLLNRNSELREKMGMRAKEWVEKQRGASKRTVDFIEKILGDE